MVHVVYTYKMQHRGAARKISYKVFCTPKTDRRNITFPNIAGTNRHMALIKDVYSKEFYHQFLAAAATVLPSINKKEFLKKIFDKDFANKEWKERMKHTTRVMHDHMPSRFSKAAPLLDRLVTALRRENFEGYSIAFMFLPDYIETYGLDDPDSAVPSLEAVTQFISCEFAVRPFILRYPQRMMQQMLRWSEHESHHVRRLSSEGSRPRLPWAMAIPWLKKDPGAILPILENLKQDPSEWVRRSVANNLNDIAKDHPQVVLDIARQWKGISKETDAIIKHGCRTLLKAGHTGILTFYGLNSKELRVSGFSVLTPILKTGEDLRFSFTIRNTAAKAQTVRLEYGIYYNKANGQLTKKVFKISERIYAPGEKAAVIKKQSFRPITTKKFYAGKHKVSIIVNGEEKSVRSFILE